MPQVTTTFELKDGRVLECKYWYHTTPGIHTLSNGDPGYPDETEVSDPEYTLEGEIVQLSDLPEGLESIAVEMYTADASDKRFTYVADVPETDYDVSDFEDEEWDG